MSRETDSSSSGPNGRGGAAYPSGTPPYGTPTASESGADAGRSATGKPPEERKTETTLTTRIRINIPGSRPIPPVVVRTPVADSDAPAEGGDAANTGAAHPGAANTGAALPSRGASSPKGGPAAATTTTAPSVPAPASPQAGEQVGGAEEKTSDWFAPRKSGTPKGGQGGGSSNGAGLPGGSAPAGPAGASGPASQGGPSGNRPGTGRPAPSNGANPLGITGGRPGGANGSGMNGGGTNGAGLPGATGAGPVAPGHGGGTGSFDVSGALRDTGSFPAVGSSGGPGGPGGPGGGGADGSGGPGASGEPRRDDLPYFSEGQGGPSGATGGPVTGDGPLVPPAGPGAAPGSLAATPGTGPVSGPGNPNQNPGRNPGGNGNPSQNPAAGAGYPGPGAGPGTGPGLGTGPTGSTGPGLGTGPGGGLSGGLSDDTAILTPQKPAPDPGPGGYGAPADNVSGHTLTSGIPVVTPGQNSPFGPGSHPDGPLPHTPPKLPEPVRQPPAGAKSAKPAKKKGRSKIPLLGGLVVVLAGGAYGAGLLMNHSDVPKGTTVLGVDIGGGTRDDAVKKLDDALGDRTNKPLKLAVDGDTVSLKPDQAGLQLDAQATVRAAAGSDYNPVSVIGSLFGRQRVVEPEMPVDEEKLQAALERAASGAGSASEGTIKFQPGKAVPVYGKAGKGIDITPSIQAVENAYRAQVETGTTTPVRVATTTRQPTVSKETVDQKMASFATPAMSANITVRTDAVHTISFSPQKSIWKFLSVQPVNGKLVEHYDLDALKALYGGAFDGVTVTKGDGSKKPVSPEEVASAVGRALVGKTPAERIVTIPTDPS
ncbi:hypothetical protein AB0912_05665 [Streptomyces sp. NPDC007084]|uniref:hypothetical protein n=1 Tax=Streptomyces sp. NPDC007084 TaxID=3154313 RepID=UPI0034527143